MDGVYAEVDNIIKGHFASLSADKEQEMRDLEMAHSALVDQVEKLKGDIEKGEAMIEAKETKIKKLDAAILELENMQAVLAQNVEADKVAFVELKKSIVDARHERDDAMLALNEVSKKVTAAQAGLVAVNEEMDKKNIEIEKASLTLKDLKAAEAEEAAKVVAVRGVLVELEFKVKNQEEKAVEKEQQITSLGERAAKIESDIAGLHLEKKGLADELASTLAEFEQEVAAERARIEKASKDLAATEDALDAKNEALAAQEEGIKERAESIQKQKEKLIEIATELSLGKEVDLSFVISQIKKA